MRLRRDPQGGLELVLPAAWRRRLLDLPRRLEEWLADPAKAAAATRRLYPRFSDDLAVEAELRALVGEELRERKRESAEAFQRLLGEGRAAAPRHWRWRLTAEQGELWISRLNDLRLQLGTALGIETNDASSAFAGDEASADQPEWLYLLLTELQHALIEELDGA